jgi:hypothetical protein
MVSDHACEPQEELDLVDIINPANGENVKLFKGWVKACEHLRDHVLSSPECEAWRLVVPEIDAVMDLDNDETRWRSVREAMQTSGAAAQSLRRTRNS